jgi:hypothetical protein
MRRKTFDKILVTFGVLATIGLIIAASLMEWGSNTQLSSQQVYFPTAAELNNAKAGTEITPAMKPFLMPYAGKLMTTGAEAGAYANHFIAIHLSEMPYHGVYSLASAAAIADPSNTALTTEVDTIFKGTTLRGMLLNAYAFGTMGQLAGLAAILTYIMAGIMLLLSVFGLMHMRATPEQAEII